MVIVQQQVRAVPACHTSIEGPPPCYHSAPTTVALLALQPMYAPQTVYVVRQ